MSSTSTRFGQIVEQRRLELDLTQLDVHAAGGPSNSTLTNIENGRISELSRSTARKLDKGLRWQPGSARATWEGGDPVPVDSRRPAYSAGDLEELRHYIGSADVDDALRRRLLQVIEDEGVRGA